MDKSNAVKTNSNKNRSYSLDVLKLIASFFVVFLHVSNNTVIKELSAFAVPVFFITSGYFSYNLIVDKNTNKLSKRIKPLTAVFIVAFIIYSAENICFSGISNYISFFKTPVTYIKFFIFNNFENTFFTPLWFIPALIYCYIAIIILLKLKLGRLINLFPLLFIVSIFLKDYGIGHYGISDILIRNFLIPGLQYFSFGFLLMKYKTRISNIKKTYLVIMPALSVLLFFILHYALNIHGLSVILIATSLFTLAININTVINNNFAKYYLKKASLYIYIIHWPVWVLLLHFNITFEDGINQITVLTLSLLLSLAFTFLKYKLNKGKNI